MDTMFSMSLAAVRSTITGAGLLFVLLSFAPFALLLGSLLWATFSVLKTKYDTRNDEIYREMAYAYHDLPGVTYGDEWYLRPSKGPAPWVRVPGRRINPEHVEHVKRTWGALPVSPPPTNFQIGQRQRAIRDWERKHRLDQEPCFIPHQPLTRFSPPPAYAAAFRPITAYERRIMASEQPPRKPQITWRQLQLLSDPSLEQPRALSPVPSLQASSHQTSSTSAPPPLRSAPTPAIAPNPLFTSATPGKDISQWISRGPFSKFSDASLDNASACLSNLKAAACLTLLRDRCAWISDFFHSSADFERCGPPDLRGLGFKGKEWNEAGVFLNRGFLADRERCRGTIIEAARKAYNDLDDLIDAKGD